MAVTRYRRAPDPLGSGTLLPESDLVLATVLTHTQPPTIMFWAFTKEFEEKVNELIASGELNIGGDTLEEHLTLWDAALKEQGKGLASDYSPAMRDTVRLFLRFTKSGPMPTKAVSVLGRRLILNRAVIGASAARVSKPVGDDWRSRVMGA